MPKSIKVDSESKLGARLGLYAAGGFIALALVFSATASLGLTASAATALYFALNTISFAALAASIVASFGIGTTMVGVVFGLVKRWSLRQFIAW